MPRNSYNRKVKPRAKRPSPRSRERRLSVRSVLRREPDVRKIARAVVALAIAKAEQEAAAQQASERDPSGEDTADA